MPPGTSPEQTLAEDIEIEDRLRDISDVYSATIGSPEFGLAAGPARAGYINFFVTLRDDAPENIAEVLREELYKPGHTLIVTEIQNGPPGGGVEIFVTGPDYADIALVSRELTASLGDIEGIVNLENTVAQAPPRLR